MDGNKIKLTALLAILFFCSAIGGNENYEGVFRFYLKTEPHTLEPSKAQSAEHNYLLSTLFRGLTRYTEEGMLIFDQAQNCRYIIDTDVRCKLREDLKFSDGSSVMPEDYVQAFKRLVASENISYLFPGILSIKNAKKINLKQAAVDSLGMKVSGKREITFLLEESDRDFLEKLSNPLLVPYKNDHVFNGPYMVDKIEKGKRWYLKTNPYFKSKNDSRPPVEILFVPEDETALNLYEKGMIDFLWRIPAVNIPKLKSRPDFFQIPISRLDYVGFNLRETSLLKDKKWRQLLVQSLDFVEFQNLFLSLGRPGCPGLSDHFLTENQDHCQDFKMRSPPLEILSEPLTFYFSQLGGNDIQRQVVWFQNQWKKHLNLKVDIKSLEQIYYYNELRKNPSDIFRKAIALNRPSCLAALEYFKSDHPDNFTGFKSKKFDDLIWPLKHQKLSRSEQNIICGAATDLLFKEEYVGVPLGRIHYSMMLRKNFKGVKINELNQLDLSELKYGER